MFTNEILPGDIISTPTGITRTPETIVVHSVHTYETGDISIRYRYACNPRGVDWSGFIPHDEQETKLVARGIAHVDLNTRSMLA